MRQLLHRIARRCDTHERYSYAVTARLERALGMETSPAPSSLMDTFSDPRLIDCGHAWCRSRQP
ncbi:hypothetical protein ACFWMH_07380 [Streptomyces tendae]|uniref:hypothetical protein n=1 Tax=Streptomyces tendae TaxID=1932 RepID=UPI0036654736